MENEEHYYRIQNELKERLSLIDSFDPNNISTVAGVDLAYWQQDQVEFAVCCIVVVDFKTHGIIEKQHCVGKIDMPYVPGLLAFRELPLVLETAKLIASAPDIYMFDGNGCLHPRHMGIASHASFYLNKPTIGVAKSYFKADGKTEYGEPDNVRGGYTDITIDGAICGRALRTKKDVKPVFVSPGNYISIETACRVTLELTENESRVPIPTRLADLETHIQRRSAMRS